MNRMSLSRWWHDLRRHIRHLPAALRLVWTAARDWTIAWIPFSLEVPTRASHVGWTPEMELVVLCARPTLTAEHASRIRALLDGGLDWEQVLDRARVHGVLGMVYHHLAQEERFCVPTDVLQTMELLSRRTQVTNLQTMQELVRLAGLFAEAGVPLLTFKGPLLAQQYYGNVAFRQFGDVDVLVHRSQLDRARALLEAHGYRLARSLTETEIERRHEEHLGLEFVHRESSVVVELHWALLNRTFSFRLDPAGVWTRARAVSLGATAVQVLAPADLLLYLCAHGAKHHWSRLLCACDVAQVLRAHPGLLDDNSLLKRARRVGSLRVLLLGLRLTERWLGLAAPASVHAAINADPTVKSLVSEIEDRWFGTEAGLHPPANRATLWFFLRTRERLRDTGAMLGHYLRLALAPTENDRGVVPARLPAGPDVGPYLVRPVRLLGKGLRRLRSALPIGVASSSERPSPVRQGRRLVRAVRRRSWAERWDLVVALGTVGVVGGLLHTCSFQRVVRLVDRWARTDGTARRLPEVEEKRLLAAVQVVSRRLLPERPCLTEALTARLLLGRRGARPTELRIGVARGADGALAAHAWLERNGTVLTGGATSPAVYAPLTTREGEKAVPVPPRHPVPNP